MPTLIIFLWNQILKIMIINLLTKSLAIAPGDIILFLLWTSGGNNACINKWKRHIVLQGIMRCNATLLSKSQRKSAKFGYSLVVREKKEHNPCG